MENLGYCCINTTLREKGIFTNRGMIKKTFLTKGTEYVSELVLLNLQDLFKILEWNLENNIRIFRISSTIFPWMSEYNLKDLPQWNLIQSELTRIGNFVLENNMRVGFHPGQFCVLPSPTAKVVTNTINELDKSAEILDLMGLPINHQYSLNIHVGGSYGDRISTMERFCTNFSRLSDSAKKRLVIENDDKESQYGVRDLYDGIYSNINVPITFDFFHHTFCTNDMTIDEAAEVAASTWPDGIRPLAHYSSSKKVHEDESVMARSHADYVYEQIPEIGNMFDIEVEAKGKELALFKYYKDWN
jgi:UV DNA damage endonuclease